MADRCSSVMGLSQTCTYKMRLYCMRVAPPVNPNYRINITLELSAESAYGGGIQSMRCRPSATRKW